MQIKDQAMNMKSVRSTEGKARRARIINYNF